MKSTNCCSVLCSVLTMALVNPYENRLMLDDRERLVAYGMSLADAGGRVAHRYGRALFNRGVRSVKRKQEDRVSNPVPNRNKRGNLRGSVRGTNGTMPRVSRASYRGGRRTRRRFVRKRRGIAGKRKYIRRRRVQARNGMRLPKARYMTGFPLRALVNHRLYLGPYHCSSGTWANTGTNFKLDVAYIGLNNPYHSMKDSYTGDGGTLDTASGEQPKWFDEYKVLYNKYRVYKATVTAVVRYDSSAGDVNTDTVKVVFDPHTSDEIPSTRNFADWAQLNEWSLSTGTCRAGKTVRLSREYSIPAIERENRILWKSDEDYSAASSASPVKIPALKVFLMSKKTAAPDANDNITVEFYISFKMMWYNQSRNLAQDS